MAISFDEVLGSAFSNDAASELVITLSGDMTGENIHVGTKGSSGAVVTGITDDKSNSYTEDVTEQIDPNIYSTCCAWSCLNGTPLESGDSITVTFNKSSAAIGALAVSSSGLGGTRDQSGTNNSTTSGTSGSVSAGGDTSSADQLVLLWFSTPSDSGSYSFGAGWTDAGADLGKRIHLAYRIISSVETPSGTFSWTNSANNYTTALRSFPAPAAVTATRALAVFAAGTVAGTRSLTVFGAEALDDTRNAEVWGAEVLAGTRALEVWGEGGIIVPQSYFGIDGLEVF